MSIHSGEAQGIMILLIQPGVAKRNVLVASRRASYRYQLPIAATAATAASTVIAGPYMERHTNAASEHSSTGRWPRRFMTAGRDPLVPHA